jgi:DNA-binding NarL/FixJ family response regulator
MAITDGIRRATVPTYLIEPQALFVPFVTRLLSEAGLMLVGSGGHLDQQALASVAPHAVVVDLDYLERSELAVLRQLRGYVPSASILAFSSRTDHMFAAAAHVAGANAVFSKDITEERLIAGIRRTITDGFFVDAERNPRLA